MPSDAKVTGPASSLVRSQAEAWSPWGVTVNAIAPVVVHTPMTASLFADPELTARMADRTMIKRNGAVDGHVGAAVFLVSDASAYVTGQVLHVDGGFSAH